MEDTPTQSVNNSNPGKTEATPTLSEELQVESVGENKVEHGLRFFLAFFCVLFTTFLVNLDLTVTASALPSIAADLHATSNEAYWCSAGYILAQAVAQPVFGGFSEMFGRKTVLQLSLVLFLVASILCSRAQNINWLIGSRVVQGIGGGGMTTLGVMVVADLTSLHERPKYMSLLGVAHALGNLGILMGAGIVQNTTWRWMFYINIPVCTLLLVVLQFSLKLTLQFQNFREKFENLDLLGTTVLTGALTALLYGLLSGGVSRPWSSGSVIAPLVVGGVGILAFYGIELLVAAKSRRPLIPPDILKYHTSMVVMLSQFAAGYGVTALLYFLTIYFLGSARYSTVRTGVILLPTALMTPVFGIVCGVLIKATRQFRLIMLLGCAAATAGLGSFISLSPSSSTALQVGLQVILAFGIGFVYVSGNITLQATLPDHLHSPGLNLMTFFRTMGQCFGIAVSAAVFQSQFKEKVNDHLRNGTLDPSLVITSKDAESAIASILHSFPPTTLDVYALIYRDALRAVWYVAMALAAVATISSVFTQHGSLDRGLTTSQRLKQG
ncbi:hypothetical protein VTK73DRAFT_7711 [Phialemonium thermophilum]|uniref:Major facilitator superfamily (MFS) profile domain-containing protein n=1 Tax=Phialemonium thermophilum TaxID=223376 RepID=A0ABR3WDA8_9PEZI